MPGSLKSKWHIGLMFVYLVLVLAITAYAFHERSYTPYPPAGSPIHNMLISGLAQQQGHFIAVGALGHIFWRDTDAGTWHSAKIAPATSLNFTNVKFVGPGVAIAVGDGALIVRSTDAGRTWKQVSYRPKLHDALMGVSGPFKNGKLLAYGFYGLLEQSVDGGKTWDKADFSIKPLPYKPVKMTTEAARTGGLAAKFKPHVDPSGLHYYGISKLSNGKLLLVGERGLIATSADVGKTWIQKKSPYDGSYFGILHPTPNSVLIYGLRGHVFVSTDNAKTWTASKLPGSVSMFGGRVLPDGRVILVGAKQTVLVSTDGGRHFQVASNAIYGNIASILPFAKGKLLLGGALGVRTVDLHGAHKASAAAGADS